MIKRNFKKNIIFMIGGVLFSPTLFANGEMSTDLSIWGDVVVASCTIANNGFYLVSLGKMIPASILNSATPYSDWKAFTIHLRKCKNILHTVTVTFSGTPDNKQKEMYANKKGSAYATNVAVELQQASDAKNLDNGKSLISPVDSSDSVSLSLRVRAHGTGLVTSGRISSDVLMNLTYN